MQLGNVDYLLQPHAQSWINIAFRLLASCYSDSELAGHGFLGIAASTAAEQLG